MDEELLVGLKYRQLQKIAKEKGLKANLPKGALIKGILKCQAEEKKQKENNETSHDIHLQSQISTEDLNNFETTTSSQSSCSATDTDSETRTLNETFEVKESSILTNDEDSESNIVKKKSLSAFNTPTLMNASDRFEQFFAIEDEHIPVLSSGSPPKQYTVKHKSSSEVNKRSTTTKNISLNKKDNPGTPSENVQPRVNTHKDVFARLSSVTKPRNSFSRTPEIGPKENMNGQSALKGNFAKRTSCNGTTGSIQKRAGIIKSSRKPAAGRKLINSTAKKVRLMATEHESNMASQRSNIPKIIKRKMPDFAKLHAREFNKTDTLDNYLSKKKVRADALTPGPKSAKKPPSVVTTNRNKPIMASLENVSSKFPVRRSPRNAPSNIHKSIEKEPSKIFVPTSIAVKETNFNFSSKGTTDSTISRKKVISTERKPFVFSGKVTKAPAKSENKILSNITNSPPFSTRLPSTSNHDTKTTAKPLPYKPYTGKLGQWNPKKTFEERKALANKTAYKTKKGEIIKGVRLNKRAELLMKRRCINTEN